MKTRAVIYTRVSTEDQVREGYSLQAQERTLREFAEKSGFEVVGIYVDEGISGRSIKKRKELSNLLQDAEKKKFDLVLIYKLDRLSRTVRDAYTIIDTLVKNEIGVLSYSEKHINFSTAQQRAMFGMSMVFAQLEVEQISERVVFGMQEAAKSGKPMFDTPYGYRNNNGIIEIVPEEAEIVKEMFSLYKEGHGFNSIAKNFNNRGIKPPKGEFWHSNTINRCVQNKAYYGVREIHFKKIKTTEICENVYPTIIPKDEFDYAQRLRESKAELHPKSANLRTNSPVFSGFLKCSRCGQSVSTCGLLRGKRRYRCCGRSVDVCKLPTFYEHYLEEAFVETMLAIQSISNKTDDKFSQQIKKNQKIIELKRNILAIQKKKEKNHFAWENDLITDDFYKTRIIDLKTEEELTLEELEKLEANSKVPKLFRLKAEDFKSIWEKSSPAEKKKFLMTYVEDIIVDSSGISPINNLKQSNFNPVRVIDIILK